MKTFDFAKVITLLSVGILTGCPSGGEDSGIPSGGTSTEDGVTPISDRQFNSEADDIIKQEVEAVIADRGLTGAGVRIALIGALDDAHSASDELTTTGVSGAYRSNLQTAEATFQAGGFSIDYLSDRDSRAAENELRDQLDDLTSGEDTDDIPYTNAAVSGDNFCMAQSLANKHAPNASVEYMRLYQEAEEGSMYIPLYHETETSMALPVAAHAANEGVDFILAINGSTSTRLPTMKGYAGALQSAADNDAVIVHNYDDGIEEDIPSENIENLLIVTHVEWKDYANGDGGWSHTNTPYNPTMPNALERTVAIPRVSLVDCTSTAEYIHGDSKTFADIRYTATVLLTMLKETYPQLTNTAIAQIILDTASTDYESYHDLQNPMKFLDIDAALAVDPNDYL